MVTLGNWYRDTVTQIVQEGRCEAVTTGRQIGFRQEVSANGRVSGSH